MTANSELFTGGVVLREPVGGEPGYWVGAPGTFHSTTENAVYLTYRIRRPRGVHPDRGGEIRIARSEAGGPFIDIWRAEKDLFNTASIERCALWQCPDGQWRYYFSFVDSADGRWAVSVIEAPDPAQLNPARAKPLFRASALGLEGIKDPWILPADGQFYMFLSVALPTADTDRDSHNTLDIFNTGECVSATGLAVSTDLEHWTWQGIVLRPGPPPAWDCYCRRINSVIRSGAHYIAFYDGSSSYSENYEEKTGLAVSDNLRTWNVITPKGPRLISPHSSHSARYLDARIVLHKLLLFYEWARPDGAHELRMLTDPAPDACLNRLTTPDAAA